MNTYHTANALALFARAEQFLTQPDVYGRFSSFENYADHNRNFRAIEDAVNLFYQNQHDLALTPLSEFTHDLASWDCLQDVVAQAIFTFRKLEWAADESFTDSLEYGAAANQLKREFLQLRLDINKAVDLA